MPMSDEPRDCSIAEAPKRVELKGHVTSHAESSGTLTVIQASRIKVEDAPTRRYLRLRAGDIECYSRVLISVDGPGRTSPWIAYRTSCRILLNLQAASAP